MAIVSLDNLGAVGIVRDLKPWELPPEAFTDGQNIRFSDIGVEKFKGHAAVFDPPTVAPYWLLQSFKDGSFYWIYSSLTKVYVTDGTTHKDITRATGGDYGANADTNWNGGILNGVPILNNGSDNPQQWDRDFATPGKLVGLSNWPSAAETSLAATVIRPFKNYLIAMDVTEDATRFEDVIRWGHPADPGAVPSSWDYTDLAKRSGRRALSETPGAIIDGAVLGDIFVIYKEEGTFGLELIGGQLVFRTWQMFPVLGLMTRRCSAAFRGGKFHLVLTVEGDLVAHDGRQAESVVNKKWRRWLQDTISDDYFQRSFLTVSRDNSNEIWICIATETNTFPDTALVWNWRTGAFSTRALPNLAHIEWGVVEVTPPTDIIDNQEQIVDTDSSLIGARSFSARNAHLLFADPNNTKLFRGNDTQQFDGTSFTSYVERLGLGVVGRDRFGEWRTDFQRRKLLKSITPKMESTTPVRFYAASQEEKNGPVTYQGPKLFDPAVDEKVDFEAAGRFIGYRVESVDDSSWNLQGVDLDIELLGGF